ncbi:hypothetical protein GCM10020366_11440 [Saccharopolyspora gregorii]|uniref:Alcohol dehydrogenase-like C-terminal domain-containing protein n=1 Tax=Saccharopolyspora gregorii TaxID=33914 RepID=A0ABP6RKV7_9PSEU
MIQIAKQMGLHTINVVRRDGLEESLKALGGDHVLIDDAELVEKVRAICGEKLPRLASNAVGGDSALRQMDALGEYGTQVTFGAMSMRSLKVPNKFLIFKGISLRGLWITKWLAAAPREEVQQVYDQLAAWVIEGKLEQSIDTLYPPERSAKHSYTPNRGERWQGSDRLACLSLGCEVIPFRFAQWYNSGSAGTCFIDFVAALIVSVSTSNHWLLRMRSRL